MSSDVAKGEGSFEVVAAVSALCEQARQATAGTPAEREAQRIAARLQGPIRVAIAGRVKAGKSTLLNALDQPSVPSASRTFTQMVKASRPSSVTVWPLER